MVAANRPDQTKNNKEIDFDSTILVHYTCFSTQIQQHSVCVYTTYANVLMSL